MIRVLALVVGSVSAVHTVVRSDSRNTVFSVVDAEGDIIPADFHDEGASMIAIGVNADGQVSEVHPTEPIETSKAVAAELLHSRVEDTLNGVEEMVRSGARPDKGTVSDIESIVKNDLIGDLKAVHAEAQKQVHGHLALLKGCNDQALKHQEQTKKTMERDVEKARKEHADCRKQHMEKNTSTAQKCQELDGLLSEVKPPMEFPTGGSRDQMVEYVEKMQKYFCPLGPIVANKTAECENVTKDVTNHKVFCDKKQSTFEDFFCTWRTEFNDTCTSSSTCYDSAKAGYDAHVAETKDLVKKWKIEWSALHKILCYTKVWLSDGNTKTASGEQLQACNGSAIDTSAMDVDYGTPPDAAECNTKAIECYPGTECFLTSEYSAFSSYVSPTIPCLQLPGCGDAANHTGSGRYVLLKHGVCPMDRQVSREDCLKAAKSVGAPDTATDVANGDKGAPSGCLLGTKGDIAWFEPSDDGPACGTMEYNCVCSSEPVATVTIAPPHVLSYGAKK